MSEETTTTIDVEVKIKTYNAATGELLDAIAAASKLTKADAGKAASRGEVSDVITIESFKTDRGFTFPKVVIRTGHKAEAIESTK